MYIYQVCCLLLLLESHRYNHCKQVYWVLRVPVCVLKAQSLFLLILQDPKYIHNNDPLLNKHQNLALIYKIPVVFIISHRGAEGEKILAQIPMGKLTPPLLDILNIRKFIINSVEDIHEINFAVNLSQKTKKSVGILLKRNLWRD